MHLIGRENSESHCRVRIRAAVCWNKAALILQVRPQNILPLSVAFNCSHRVLKGLERLHKLILMRQNATATQSGALHEYSRRRKL